MAAITRPTCSLLGGAMTVQFTRPSMLFVHTKHPQSNRAGGGLHLVTGASTAAASGCQRGVAVFRHTLSFQVSLEGDHSVVALVVALKKLSETNS
jgi:hypothetical protein